jgi:prepilin-type N-terminal cleavage/methylation domain-containing protein
MKMNSRQQRRAFTLVEMCVVIVVLALLASIILPPLVPRHRRYRGTIPCSNNLKEIGVAYRLWESDNGGLFPAEQSITNKGWKEYLTNANQGAICWTNYSIMAADLGQSSRLLVCPADERLPATNCTTGLNNSHVSYFVEVSANDWQPLTILGGDRNLSPGARPEFDYGYSRADGLGNDVAIPLTGPVSWSLKMHSAGNPAGSGNILLGDGSVQQVTTANFNNNWLRKTDPTTTWPAGHAPASPSIRLVFP